MRTFRWMTALAALALAACGGGSSGCNGSFAGGSCGSTAGVGAVLVTSDLASIPTDGSVSANVTALVKDSNNNALSGVTVTFSSNAGSLVVSQGTTDATGVAKAALSGSGVASGSSITVTAAAGSVSGKVVVAVVNTQRTVTVTTSLPQIPSDGSKSATIAALVRDANNNVVTGAPVSFQATSGALTGAQMVTDATGTAKASLTAGSDPTNRAITVTVTSGTATANVVVQVTGTTLTITGPANLILGQSGNFSAVLTNSAGQGISGTTVTLASANGNALSTPLPTDVSGHTSFTVTASVGGTDTITATALGLQQQVKVTVSTDNFVFSSPLGGTKINLGASQAVTVHWTTAGAPKVGQMVNFTATRGTLTTSSATTDASGNATVSITSTSAGPVIISATGTGVSAQLSMDFVAINPTQVSVQAGPATVAVGGQSTISATVRDAANNLVEGSTVDFSIVTDPTNGGLQQATVVSNTQGIAQTVYVAGNTSSGANGVQVSATVRGTSVSGTTNLTVGGQTVFLSLGTGNTIDTSAGSSVYQITYSVFAIDASGAALGNVPVTLQMLPVAYGKGYMAGCPGGTNWSPNYTTLAADANAYGGQKMCRNEDTDYTGNISSLDPSGPITTCVNIGTSPSQTITSHQKDYNCNGKLDPGNVAVVSPSFGNTDANGRLDVTVTYPRDHAYWVEVSLVAKTTVNGTESSTSSTFVLQGAVTDYACAVGPPGPVSPYGQATTCANPN